MQTLATVTFTLASGQKAIMIAQVAAGGTAAAGGSMSTRILDGGVTVASCATDFATSADAVATAMVGEITTAGAHTVNLQASASQSGLTVNTQAQLVALISAV